MSGNGQDASQDPSANGNGKLTGRARHEARRAARAERAGLAAAPDPDVIDPIGLADRQPVDLDDVDGAELLDDLRTFITRYVVLPSPEAADLLALWVLHTWAVEAAFATPYLRITSATPDSGKTLLLEVLAAVCQNGWHAVNPSVAVLYRKVHLQSPTLLLDEVDNYSFEDRREALSALNAGYKRGATVDRCKDSGELESFRVFCPKVYAGLDTKATVPTLLSRSITIRLERKRPDEQVGMWIAPLVKPAAAALRDRCGRWAWQNVDDLAGVDLLASDGPGLPPGLANRAVEIWWALVAIAEQVEGDWPARVRQAARVLATGGDSHDESSEQVRLLSDIRSAFGGGQTIHTEALLAQLNADDEHPWGAKRRGEGLDARGLSRMLRPFGIKPRTVRVSGVPGSLKGYHFAQFGDAFHRHLPGGSPQPSHPSHPSHPAPHGKGDVTDVTLVTATETPQEQLATPEQEAMFERLSEIAEGGS